MKKVSKIYEKYKVSSMFKDNLIKEIPGNSVDTVIEKGYLKEINLKGTPGRTIIFLVS